MISPVCHQRPADTKQLSEFFFILKFQMFCDTFAHYLFICFYLLKNKSVLIKFENWEKITLEIILKIVLKKHFYLKILFTL